MILSSFSYKTSSWELKELSSLQFINLLVGKNASGKSRTIKAIQNVSSFLQMKNVLLQDNNFSTSLTFIDPNMEDWEMSYSFEISNNEVIKEQLKRNGKTLIERNSKKTLIENELISPPREKLVVQIRRDREAYPYTESLMEWAERVLVISFSDINPYTILFTGQTSFTSNPFQFSELVRSLNTSEKNSLKKDARSLDYNIADIKSIKVGDVNLVELNEKYIKHTIPDFRLSSGMMRTLYLLCFLIYIKRNKKCSLLLIDDLGEGLDYRRVTALAKKVIETCEKEHIQVIASSNDALLMDMVDISKWQIIRRNKNVLTVLNQNKDTNLFNEFRITGLSNFDFFSSDFIDNFLEVKNK